MYWNETHPLRKEHFKKLSLEEAIKEWKILESNLGPSLVVSNAFISLFTLVHDKNDF